MNKKKKIIILIICILSIIFISLFHMYLLPYAYVYTKYGNLHTFKLKNYNPWKLELYDSASIIPSAKFVTEKWEMESDDITFQIQKINNRLIDDYQLEELDKLCTEYLQENVEPNICHVLITTQMLVETNEKIQSNLVWDRNNITNFLNCQKSLKLYAFENKPPNLTDSEILNNLSNNSIKVDFVITRTKSSNTKFGREKMSNHGICYSNEFFGEVIR